MLGFEGDVDGPTGAARLISLWLKFEDGVNDDSVEFDIADDRRLESLVFDVDEFFSDDTALIADANVVLWKKKMS